MTDLLEALRILETQKPCKRRKDRNGDPSQSHKWELLDKEPILDYRSGAFRDGTVLRCYICRLWFEPIALEVEAS